MRGTLLILALFAGAQDASIKYEPDLEAAQKESVKKKLAVLIFFYQPICEFCKAHTDESLTQAEVVKESNRNFVNVMLNTKAHRPLVEKYRIPTTPSIVLTDSKGAMLGSQYGYAPRAEYERWLRGAAAVSRNVALLETPPAKPQECAQARELADGLASLSEDERALEFYRKALDLNERRKESAETRKFKGETLSRRAILLFRQGKDASTVGEAVKALRRLDPDGKLGFQDNAALLRILHGAMGGEEMDLLAAAEDALRRFPDSDVTDGLLFIKAHALLVLKSDAEGARLFFKKVVSDHPDSLFRSMARGALEGIGDG